MGSLGCRCGVQCAFRCPACRRPQTLSADGEAPARNPLSSRPFFPFCRLRAPSSPRSGLSARRLLLTDRVCVVGAALCSRAVPPTRVTILGGGGEDAMPGPPLCGLTFPERAHLPGRLSVSHPRSPNSHAFTFQRSCVPSLSRERRWQSGLWAGPGAHKGEEVPQGPRATPFSLLRGWS